MKKIYKKEKTLIFLFTALFAFTLTSGAEDPRSYFKLFAPINFEKSENAQVVEFEDPEQFFYSAIYDKTKGKFVPFIRVKSHDYKPIELSLVESNAKTAKSLFDNELSTYADFDVDFDKIKKSEIIFNIKNAKNIEGIKFFFDKNSARPLYISIYDTHNARMLLNRVRFKDEIKFPAINTSQLIVRLEHNQPLRIREIKVIGENIKKSKSYIRFLAEPGSDYLFYTDGVYYFKADGERPNLHFVDEKEVQKASLGELKQNPLFKEPDSDNDGIPNKLDNCVYVPNPDQTDKNGNGKGDACEDYDKDGVLNYKDNCINTPNVSQIDTDKDGKGDACDNEESRFFEKNQWILWVLVLVLIASTSAAGVWIATRSNTKQNES